jgi:hypothetical protein
MDALKIRLNPFILSRASLRARLIHNRVQGMEDESAEPLRLIRVIANQRDALRAAEELYGIVLSLLGPFDRNWKVDLSEAIANGDSACLYWHERLILGIEGDDRAMAIDAVENLRRQWGRDLDCSHGWTRSAARHTHRIADWLLGEGASC